MDQELTEFLIDQFSNIENKMATKDDITALSGDISELRGNVVELREDIVELRTDVNDLKSDMHEVKADVKEIKITVKRLDRRTGEDVRAVIKDVEKIKIHLNNQGVKL